MTILGSSYVTSAPPWVPPERSPYVHAVFELHGINVLVHEDDPYYTVFYVGKGKSLASEGMIEEISEYVAELKALPESELLEKLSAI